MSNVNTSWIGRKGRSSKEAGGGKVSCNVDHTKQSCYGSSELLVELNSILANFTVRQTELAASTGFKTFARPVNAVKFDRQFTVWLMPKVDTMNRSVSAYVGRRLMIFQEDVGKVFGIPCSGKEVWDSSLDKSEAMRGAIGELLGMDERNSSPIAAAAKVLRELAGQGMSIQEEVPFKVAFLVYVVCMLCDSRNSGETESRNFWPAIKDPEHIHKFNWASFVLESVFSACVAARMATRKNSYYSPPAGTVIFLQIFYLDNMDYGQISIPKGHRPRLELYDERILSKQIMAETIGLRGQTPCRIFGAGKVRKDNLVVYRRGLFTRPATHSPPASENQQKRPRADPPVKLPEKTTTRQPISAQMQALVAVKAHKARCLKILTLARKSIEEETDKLVETFTNINFANSGASKERACVNNIEQAHEIDISSEEPFTPSPTLPCRVGPSSLLANGKKTGPCEAPSFSLGDEFDADDIIGPATSSIIQPVPLSPLGPSPPRKSLRRSSPKSPLAVTKKKSGEYLFNKRSSTIINLNDTVVELEFTQTPINQITVQEGKLKCPPRDTSWNTSNRHHEAAKILHSWVMSSAAEGNRVWIRHECPKFIEISASQIIEQFKVNGTFEPDTCDALLRRFQQSNAPGSTIDWRHYLETDFPMRVIAGEDIISSRSIQNQWVGNDTPNDISKCMLHITIVKVANRWASYAWDMKRKQVTIYGAGNVSGEWDAYDQIKNLLDSAFRRCIETFFDGWTVDWTNWATIYTTSTALSTRRSDNYDYAPETLQFARTFDGVKQGGRLTSPKEEVTSPADLLYEMLHLKNNTGNLPSQFIQDLD